MPILLHLDGAPSDEPCAQVGRTHSFAILNDLEVEVYRAAIIAVYGPPPTGFALRSQSNPHDFGRYSTLALVAVDTDPARIKPSMADGGHDYARQIENGLARWTDAMFTKPVDYDDDGRATIHTPTVDEAIIRALIATRRNGDGNFAVDLFARVNANLTAQWPSLAAEAERRTSQGADHVE